MLNKLFLIKSFHTAVFFFQLGCLAYLLYAGISGTFHWLWMVAAGSILLNGVALLLNRCRCPLTTLAEKHGAFNGSVTDLFLPGGIADNVFRVGVVLFPAELILLATRYFLT